MINVPHRVLVAPSGFKESLSAEQVADAIAAGVRCGSRRTPCAPRPSCRRCWRSPRPPGSTRGRRLPAQLRPRLWPHPARQLEGAAGVRGGRRRPGRVRPAGPGASVGGDGAPLRRADGRDVRGVVEPDRPDAVDVARPGGRRQRRLSQSVRAATAVSGKSANTPSTPASKYRNSSVRTSPRALGSVPMRRSVGRNWFSSRIV